MPSKSNPSYAMHLATSDEGMCLKDFTLFHAFNENGAMAIKLEANKAINKAIDDGALNMILSPNKFKAQYHVQGVKDDAKKAHTKIAEAYSAMEAA